LFVFVVATTVAVATASRRSFFIIPRGARRGKGCGAHNAINYKSKI
jgi:hypothetical protein